MAIFICGNFHGRFHMLYAVTSGNLLHSYWKWQFIVDLPINSMVDLSIVFCMLCLVNQLWMDFKLVMLVMLVMFHWPTFSANFKFQVQWSPPSSAGRDVELLCGDTGECIAMTGLASVHRWEPLLLATEGLGIPWDACNCPKMTNYIILGKILKNWILSLIFNIFTRWCPPSYKLVYNPINYRYITYKP